MKIGLPLAAITIARVLFWAGTREDRLPDVLSEFANVYFERLGFCFVVIPTIEENQCIIQILFQNRYGNSCTARILLRHCTFFPKRQKNKLAPVAVEIDCPGGACGLMYLAWPIPIAYQGTTQLFDIGADISYPKRRGKLLRFREGIPVGGTVFPTMAGLAQTPARCELTLPSGVAESVPEDTQPIVKIIWHPGMEQVTRQPESQSD